MALDTFICGTCQITFNDMDEFIHHKKVHQTVVGSAAQLDSSTVTTEVNEETTNANNNTEAPLNMEKDQVVTLPEGSQVVTTEIMDSVTGEQQTVIIIQSANSSDQTAVTQSLLEGTLMTAVAQDQNISVVSDKQTAPEKAGPGRKRGKRKRTSASAEKITKFQKPEVPEIAADGKLHCKCCKRSFYKERFFKTHRCMPTTDYVDITKKDAIVDSDENVVPDSDEEMDDNDKDDDFRINDYKAEEEDGEGKDGVVQVSTDPDNEAFTNERPTDSIGDIPIFRSDEDKALFEQSLNVDLSFLDNMFKQHAIEQDLNEKAPMASRMATTSLSLYSCNSCEKIFKTLSHMRLHCLVHTELRPFKCPKCSYASNAKGNLYTHMRKHTGQYYRCKHCDFKSVNKSHLLEHQATHNNKRHQCDLCKKDYNTLKSLINHVRKYHSKNQKGMEYLATFLQGGRQRGTTIIHQCHVCNRKFKKKIDRDRHLYVHDIRDIPTIQACELCDYTASRRVYLEKHFLKHRVIYRCVQCKAKFLSTIKLIDHLTSVHLKDDPTTRWESLFEECINYSLYLPEPDESLSNEEKNFVNLPPELSSSEISNDGLHSAEKVASQTQNGKADKESKDDKPETAETKPETVETKPETETNDTKKEKQSTESIDAADKEKEGKEEISGEEKEAPQSENEQNTTPAVKENADKNTQANEEELGPESVEEGEGTEHGDNNTDNEEDPESGEKHPRKSIIDTMGYRPMTLQIFHKMRETFGHEECEYCGKLYYHKMDFDQHIRTHTGEKPFPCTICGFRGVTKEVLQQHKETEHEKLMFPCKDCEFVALSRSQLWNHSLRHAGLGEAMGIECPVCHEKMDSLKKLKFHVSQQHPESNSEELTKMHMGPYVEKSPTYKHKTQGKIGRRSYKCPYCDKVFIRANSELQKHIWIHEGVKPYKCPLCPHACRSKSNLQAHMLRHSDEKPYSCSECNKAYKSKTALRWHVRSHKTGKIFKCAKCPYEATQSSHLRRHMEIHDIVKRYVCQHCDYSANTLGYMKIHYTKSHKGETYKCLDVPKVEETEKKSPNDSQVYRCLSCDYLFGNLSDLKRHLKVRHHLQIQHFQGLDTTQQGSSQTTTEVQVLQYTGDNITPDIQQVAETNTISTENHTVEELDTSSLDEKTASAVNILQQIFGMSQQTPGAQQHFTVQSDDGEVVAVNQDTIIVQQEGEEVLVTDGNAGIGGNQQYVIQYVSPQDGQLDSGSLLEVQTVADVQAISHVGDIQTIGDSQEVIQNIDQQVIIGQE